MKPKFASPHGAETPLAKDGPMEGRSDQECLSFLTNLPTTNPENFSRYRVPNRDGGASSSSSSLGLEVYVTTRDEPEKPQLIVNDHSNSLLRHVHKEWEKAKQRAASETRKRRGSPNSVTWRSKAPKSDL